MNIFISTSKENTFNIARNFAKKIKKNQLILFKGDIGSGKTTFINGFVSYFNYDKPISSPTYSILNIYETIPNILHFDMYRISSLIDLETTGFFDYINSNYIILVEWSENIISYIKEDFITVSIEKLDTDINHRKIIFS